MNSLLPVLTHVTNERIKIDPCLLKKKAERASENYSFRLITSAVSYCYDENSGLPFSFPVLIAGLYIILGEECQGLSFVASSLSFGGLLGS
jgi:hypothetical protein